MGLYRSASDRAKRYVAASRGKRWPRRLGISLAVVLTIYTLGGFFGVPYALRRILTGQVASTIHRPITVGRIAFNPYRLRLEVGGLHVGDRDPQRPFVDLGALRVKVSWSSIWRLAPVVGEFYLDGLRLHIARTGEQNFNFSDLLPSGTPAPPSKQPAKPFRFAVSNIQLNDGAIAFDDQVLAQQHTIEHVRLALPFIANLPGDVDIFAQPFLQMIIDGSRFSLNGRTKPFGRSLETILDLDLHRFDLPRYMSYVPVKLPIKLPQGSLSTVLQLHFQNADGQPHIRIDGGLALDAIDLRDPADAPLLSLGHTSVALNTIEPLAGIFHVRRVFVDRLNSHLMRNADGTTNLTPLTAVAAPPPPSPSAPAPTGAATPLPSPASVSASPAQTLSPQATPTASSVTTPQISQVSPSPTPPAPFVGGIQVAGPSTSPTPAAQATPVAKPPTDFALDSFELVNSSVDLIDRTPPTPGVVALNAIHTKLANFRTIGDSVAPFEMTANLGGGGAIASKGSLALAKHQVTADATLNQIDLPALKAFAQSFFNGQLISGKLSATATVRSDFDPSNFNLHVEPANAAVENLELRSVDGKEKPLRWGKFAVAVAQVDLASRQAVINEIRTDALKMNVRRDRRDQINLLALLRNAPATATPPAAARATLPAPRSRSRRKAGIAATPQPVSTPGTSGAQWRYSIGSVVLDQAEIHSLDEHTAKPVKLDVVPLQVSLKEISSDLSKPITIAIGGTVSGKGTFKIDGTAAPKPLDAKLRIATKRLDLTALNAYLGDQLNATIAALTLTMNGAATATQRRDGLHAGYRGDMTLGGARILDKLTGDNFLRFGSFSASKIAADYGGGNPKIRIGGIGLSNFYSRIILESNGRLNFKDITTSPHEAPQSLTRPNQIAAATVVATPSPTATPAAAPATASAVPPPTPHPLPAEVELGGITLQGGHVNYTDNFIEPHYTADLTDIGGSIGAFGTSSTNPADVLLDGQVNDSAPLKITGSVNPLAPMAFVDLAAKANGIELPGLSPYSTKYTGYPIVKGSLTVDVHYLLRDQQLTANNHIFIDQLTFGDKVASKDAINLPIRLAVALLKDARGAIDLTIPVSGSLNDPQFSIGGVIWQVIKNLIVKAATAPFSLIASAVNGAIGGGGGAELNYIEFEPGYALITPDSQKRLDTIAKALGDRPSLKLDIAGRVDPKVDQDGLRQAKLDHQVLEQKIKDLSEDERNAGVTVGRDEYDKYLKRAYKAADFEKPRDLVGLTKSLPPDEMKKLLIAHETVSDDDLHHLADARANAVRAALSQKIDPSRLFLLPPKLNADDVKDQGKTSRVDLTLE